MKSKNEKETLRELRLSDEARSIIHWCKKKKVTCNWVLYGDGNTRTLCMNRGPVFVHSESMTNEEATALTYEQMKELLKSLYKNLKEREG